MTLNRVLVTAEIVAVAGALAFGVIWLIDPSGNWEPPFGLCTLLVVGIDVFRRVVARRPADRFESNDARIRHRENLRKTLQEEIYRCRAEKLRQDVIIRHVERVDKYPNLDDKQPGISPWFRVGLVDTYTNGIRLGLRFGGLKECVGGYRFVDYVNDEKSDITALLMGDVPYDSIVEANMRGDEYYHYPHIYCHFDFNGQPYERLWFAEQIDQDHGHPYFKHLANYDDVVRNNPSDGKLYF